MPHRWHLSHPRTARWLKRALQFAAPALCAVSLAGAQGSIAGKVTDRATGGAIGGAEVSAVSGATIIAHTVSKDDGSYVLGGIAPGSYTVAIRKLGYDPRQMEQVSVTSGAAMVNVVMSTVATPLDAVAVTGTLGAKPERVLDSPNSISVVGGVQIAERAAAVISDHLKAVPGLSVSTGGVVQANIVSRAFNNAFSGQMLMLQDYRFAGVPSLHVNVPFLFTGSNEDIERIEVLQGPAAVLYGPNSGNGVLHIITKSPFDSRGTTLTLTGGTRSASGSQEIGRFSGRHAGVLHNGKVAYKISGEVFTGQDFNYRDPNEPTAYSTTDPRVPVSRRGQPVLRDFGLGKQTAEARVDYRLDENTEFITTAGYSHLANAIELTTAFGAMQGKNWTYSNLQERFHHKGFFAQVFYDASNSGNADSLDLHGTYYLRTGIPVVDRSSVLVGQVQQAFDQGLPMHSKVLVGGEYIATRPKTFGTIDGRNENNDNINEYGAYVQSTTPFTSKVDLLLAARGDGNNTFTGVQFSPRAALVFKPAPDQNVRVTFNRTLNSPASYSLFLDQFYAVGAPGMDVRVMGNPVKQGWTFANSCAGALAANASLCMRSPYAPAALLPASAAAAYPGMIQALPALVAGLQAQGKMTASQAAGVMAVYNGYGPILNGLKPTEAQVNSYLLNLDTQTPADNVSNYGALGASFTNTWEVGYKGVLAGRIHLDVDAWLQRRPGEPAPGLINPGVMFNGTQLGAYLTQSLMTAGVSQAAAVQAAGAIAGVMAQIPSGATAFTNALYDKPYLVTTYRAPEGFVTVQGFDVAGDVSLTREWTLTTTYSNLSKNVFYKSGLTGAAAKADSASPLASNTPKHRASVALRYDAGRGYAAELRGRYADAFPVNSGVLNSYHASPGAPFVYERVPVNMLVDVNSSWIIPWVGSPRVSVTATNLLNSQVPTFVGVPAISRMIMTQVQYTF